MIQHPRGLTRGRAGPQTENLSRAVPGRIDLGNPRPAFTMVELLVVMVVIGIIAGITLGALNAARESARVAKTKATIAKLDSIVVEKYESYLTRRVPIKTSGLAPNVAAAVRLLALRDLMRMEMPDRWNDVSDGPLQPNKILDNWPSSALHPDVEDNYTAIPRPALSVAYNRRLANAKAAMTDLTEEEKNEKIAMYGSAECLYLLVTLGNPEARSLFSDSEVADADSDGLFEFIDGWGNPINFLRWAPGLTTPDPNTPFMGSDLQTDDPETDHDPFDPRHVELATGAIKRGFRLVPLIFSAGPDGVYAVSVGFENTSSGYVFRGSPYVYYDGSELKANPSGKAVAGDNISVTGPDTGTKDNCLDNIHNHRLEVK